MIKRLIIVVVGLIAVFGGIFGWKAYQGMQMAAGFAGPPPPATVASAAVKTESWQPFLEAVGSLTASQGVYVTTEVAGQVKAIHFRSGGHIKKGDLLLQLDDDVDQADLAGLVAERKLAKLQFARMARLYNDGKLASRSDYDEAQATLENAEAKVVARQALIRKKKIRAPFAGMLGIRQVDLGQYLSPGSQIVLLQALDPVYVDFSLPERRFSEVVVGQKVVINVQAYPDQEFEGRVSAINPGLDSGARNLRVRAVFDNPDGQLRAGMFASVRTILPTPKVVLTLPRTAINYAPYGDSVFVVVPQGDDLIVQRRQVRTGEVRGDRIEIISGLHADEQVVSAGQVKLRNGQHVKINNSVNLTGQATGS